MSKLWTPPHIKKILDEQLELNMCYPELFNSEVGVPPRKTYFVSGRPGLKKTEALTQIVTDFKQKHKTVVFIGKCFEIADAQAPELQKTQLETILEFLHEQPINNSEDCARILILDKGHSLALSADPDVRRVFNETIPALLKRKHALMIVCCDCTMAQIPRETQLAYQYERQLFFPTPDDEWRKQYFRHRLTVYEGFVLQHHGGKLRVVFDKEHAESMLDYLVDCSGSATIQEMDDFCAALFNSVHRIVPPDPSTEKHLDATGQFRVLNWERCKDFLVDRGGCYCISRIDGEALEQEYSLAVAGNRGLTPERERLPETKIENNHHHGDEVNHLRRRGGGGASLEELPSSSSGGGPKLLKSESERIRFDKDGHEIPVSGPIDWTPSDPDGSPCFSIKNTQGEPESKKIKF